jgi:hypothetical protein
VSIANEIVTVNSLGNIVGGNIEATSVVTSGNVTANYVVGNGSLLSSITGANVTGTVANATQANTANVANSVAGGNVTGQVANALVAGTVYTAAQPNITSLGTLTSLSVTGNTSTGGILTNNYYYANGTPVSFGGTYGNANVATFLASGFGSNTISTTGNIAAGYFTGNGSQLTGITTSLAGNLAGNINTLNYTISSSSGAVQLADDVVVTGNLQLGGYIFNSASTNKTVTGNGNAQVSTSVVKFGSGSFQTDGVAGTYLSTPVTTDFIMGTGNFTIEMFWYPTSVGVQTQVLFDMGVLGSAFDYRPQIYSESGNIIYSGYNYVDDIVGTTPVTANAWNHIAVAKSSGNTKLFLNGTQVGNTFADSYNYIDGGGGQVRIGTTTYDDTSSSVFGYIDEVRVLQGEAAYTANFTPPSGPFTANANTVLLLHCDGSSGSTVFFDSSTVNDVTVDDNLVVTGDVTASGYFVGDGSQLTGIVSTPGNTFSTISANGTSIVADSSTDTLTFTAGTGISIVGNATSDTITISATGGGTYGDANVNTLLASWGSNTLSTTGNVTGGNVIATTAVKSGAVTYTGTDGTNGQVLTTYGNGITYFSTVSGGGGSPGGSDGQIQYNDGGSFGGNVAMTFDDATGNVTLGNIVIQTNQQMQTVAAYSGNSSVRNPGQITIGNGYDGNITNTTYLTVNARNARALSYDKYIKVDNGQRNSQLAALTYADLNGGNIGTANAASRIVGIVSDVFAINGNTVNAQPVTVRSIQGFVTAGTSANTGNANLSGCQVVQSYVQVNAGSRIGNAWMYFAESGNNGNVLQTPLDTYIGYGIVPRHTANTTSGNVFGVYMPGTTSTYGTSMLNGTRQASQYYFLRCDDDLAQSKLGSLRTFHEYRYDNSSSSGTLAVDKNNGQVQYVTVSEDITTVTFSNFVVSATDGTTTDYQTDTVTLIFQQDATGRTITLPTPSTTYKYAGGNDAVGSTANSVTMVSVTATYNAGLAGTQYLITVSPEFS